MSAFKSSPFKSVRPPFEKINLGINRVQQLPLQMCVDIANKTNWMKMVCNSEYVHCTVRVKQVYQKKVWSHMYHGLSSSVGHYAPVLNKN